MPSLLDGLQPVHQLTRVISAQDYNRVRLALNRLGNPLRIPLEGMRCLEMILEDKFWICLDTCKFDRPVLAWVAFNTSGRSAIHESVSCELKFYHVHSGLIMGEVLETMGNVLQQRLDAAQT
jgi:hypothetical protein